MTASPGGAVAPRAYLILAALVAATILSYVDRTILSLLAIRRMSQAQHWTHRRTPRNFP